MRGGEIRRPILVHRPRGDAPVRPDVVHVTAPPTSHYRLALDALQQGAHLLVEKPATATLEEIEGLVRRAGDLGRALVEDYNYLFNRAPLEILRRIESGEFGAVVHVDVLICLGILGPEGFADPNSPHPCLSLAGGAIADFLPHLASLAHQFVGPHRRAHAIWTKRAQSILPYDEFRAGVEGGAGTATLGFSGHAQPDAFWRACSGNGCGDGQPLRGRVASTACARDPSRCSRCSTVWRKAAPSGGPRSARSGASSAEARARTRACSI